MARSGKKQKAKSKKWLALAGHVKNKVVGFRGEAVSVGKKIRGFILGIPAWIKARPQAFKDWRTADKKKKKYRSFKLQKRIKPEPRYIPPSATLFRQSLAFLWSHKKVISFMLVIHAGVYFLLVRNPATADIGLIQEAVETTLGAGSTTSVEGIMATFGAVLGSAGTPQNTTVATILVLFVSLAYIWAIRQLHNGAVIKARDGYYQGMAGLVPVVLLLIVLSIQLIPFAAAGFVYSAARAGGLFASGIEDMSIFVIALLIGLLSFYWLTSTVIALYIATLPGMYPLHALRAAKKLVQFQRFKIFRRILGLGIILGLLYAAILLIIIRFWPQYVFISTELLPILVVPFVHTYLYKLYKASI